MRLVMRVLVGVAALLFVSYVVDWAVWRAQVARGSGMGEVEVFQVSTAPLKGNKEAIYSDGSTVVECSRSVYPQAGGGACWWVERHREVVKKY